MIMLLTKKALTNSYSDRLVVTLKADGSHLRTINQKGRKRPPPTPVILNLDDFLSMQTVQTGGAILLTRGQFYRVLS